MSQLWLSVCLPWNLLFSAAFVCTTADRAPHVCLATKMSSAENFNKGRCASCVPYDVVTTASLAQSNVSSKWVFTSCGGIQCGGDSAKCHGKGTEHGRTATAREEQTVSTPSSPTSVCGWKLLPLCAEHILSVTADAGHLLRWLDLQDVTPHNRVACCSGPHEACILSLFIVLQKTWRDRSVSFQLQDMLQDLIFSPSCWQHDLLLNANIDRVLPSSCILERTGGTRTNVEGMPRCCNEQSSRKRPSIPVSSPVARTDHGRHLGGRKMTLPGGLLCNAGDSSVREGPVAPTPRLAQKDEVKRDAVRPDLCVCECNLRETQFRQYHSFSWSVFHDPLLRCTVADILQFFDLSKLSFELNMLWKQQGFYFSSTSNMSASRISPWHAMAENYAPSTPLGHTAQDSASNRRHTSWLIIRMATHPAFCVHVLPWLDRSEFRQIRMACNHLPQNSGSSRWSKDRETWHEKMQIASWRTGAKKQKTYATRGAIMVLATMMTARRDTQRLDTCSAHLRRTIIPQPRDCTMDSKPAVCPEHQANHSSRTHASLAG